MRDGWCRTSRRCFTTTPCCSARTPTGGVERRNPLAERVVTETVAWLLREMRTEQGAFAASLDADSKDDHGELREGAYYVWDRDQLLAALDEEDAAWAAEVFSVTPTGTFEHGASTLQLRSDHDQVRLADVRERLRIARDQRSRPGRDDKVVAAWNGLLVDALVQAAMIFARPEWLQIATQAAEHVWQLHWREGRLRRTSRDGIAGGAFGILEDYAALALAAVRLAAVHAAPLWLTRAEQLLEVIMEQFNDAGGGFFDTAADAEQLYTRPQDPTDNATPSGLSAAVHALRLMAELTGEDRYAARADRAATSAGELVRRAPRFAGWLLADAISQTSDQRPVQVAVVGPDDSARAALVHTAHQLAPAGSVVMAGMPDQPGLALLADRPMINDRPTAYVCRHFVCRLPVTSVDDLANQLQASDSSRMHARSGSRAAVLDERTSRHALRLRVREEGSGSKARSSRAERAIRHCASSSKSNRDHGDCHVVAHETCDGGGVEDLMKAEPGGGGVGTLSAVDHRADGVADAAGHYQDHDRRAGSMIEGSEPAKGGPAHDEVERGVEPARRR